MWMIYLPRRYLADLILHFFEDFSRFESRVPDFLHPELDHASLATINLGGKDIKGKAPFFFYKRWLWVAFPWLALGTMDGGARPSSPSSSSSSSSSAFAVSGSPTNHHHHGDGAGGDGFDGDANGRGGGSSSGGAGGDGHGTDGGGSGGAGGGSAGSGKDGSGKDREYVSVMKKSFWATKKVAPSKGPTPINSARMNSRVTSASPAQRIMGGGGSGGGSGGDGSGTSQGLSTVEKALRPSASELKSEAVSRADRVINYGAEIPFSQPSVRTKKAGSRFPSVEANLREKGQRLTPIFSGGVIPPDRRALPATATDAQVHFQNLPAHLTSYPVTVTDAKRAESTGMLLKLREKYDKLTYESSKLQQHLAELRKQVSEREKQVRSIDLGVWACGGGAGGGGAAVLMVLVALIVLVEAVAGDAAVVSPAWWGWLP
jgi:hypothetical protein